jgi:putative Holliday junction resolvase
MIILGIDFGLKKIGLAIAENDFPTPIAVIKNDYLAVGKIASLCLKNEVEKVVIGLPEGKLARGARGFGNQLERKIHLPITYHPEILTTQEAIAKMIEVGKSKKYRKEKEDAFSAALLLESFLASN